MSVQLKNVKNANWGNQNARYFNLTGTGTYPAGGVPFTPAMTGFLIIQGVIPNGLAVGNVPATAAYTGPGTKTLKLFSVAGEVTGSLTGLQGGVIVVGT